MIRLSGVKTCELEVADVLAQRPFFGNDRPETGISISIRQNTLILTIGGLIRTPPKTLLASDNYIHYRDMERFAKKKLSNSL